MPETNNYITPTAPFAVNGVSDPTSQRFHVRCTEAQPYDPSILSLDTGHLHAVQRAHSHNTAYSSEVRALISPI